MRKASSVSTLVNRDNSRMMHALANEHFQTSLAYFV